MSRKPAFYYPPVGTCIYCASDGGTEGLTKEHIVPYSLEGTWVLPKSSCRRCAGITSSLEKFCARNLYGSFRIREGLKTRRLSKRPSRVKVEVRTSSGVYSTTIPEKGAISQFPIIRLSAPGALRIPPVEPDTWDSIELGVKSDSPRELHHWEALPNGDLAFSPMEIDLSKFSRLCAKIGHGFAVAEFGLNGFSPWLSPYILGSNLKLAYVVGSSHEAQRFDNAATVLNWSVHETQMFALLVITVHLFPAMGQPPIAVVAGSLSSVQLEKIRSRSDANIAA